MIRTGKLVSRPVSSGKLVFRLVSAGKLVTQLVSTCKLVSRLGLTGNFGNLGVRLVTAGILVSRLVSTGKLVSRPVSTGKLVFMLVWTGKLVSRLGSGLSTNPHRISSRKNGLVSIFIDLRSILIEYFNHLRVVFYDLAKNLAPVFLNIMITECNSVEMGVIVKNWGILMNIGILDEN